MLNGSFFDIFFFGFNSKKNISDNYKLNKKWAGLNIFYDLLSLVMSRFEYDLPDGMDPRFFELCLLCDGQNVTVIRPDGRPGNFKVGYGNPVSEYGYLNSVQTFDYMGRTHGNFIPLAPGNVMPDAVITYDNEMVVPPILKIKWYADRLTNIMGSMTACLANMKGATIIKCSKEQEPAVKRAWKNADDGSPVIISFAPNEGGYDIDPEVITNPQTGDILKELQEAYDKTMAEFLTKFGINANGVINKLSGVSDDELSQNNQAIQLKLQKDLKMRQDGIKNINELFGLNCSVKLAESLEIKNISMYNEEKEEIDDDDI